MNKIAHLIVRFRNVLLVAFIVFSLASIAGVLATNINKDMTKYIPADMSSKIGTELLGDEFGDSSQFNVMYKGLSDEQKDRVADDLEGIVNVTAVQHDDTADFENGDASLYVVVCDGDTYSQEAYDTWQGILAYNEANGLESYIDSAVIDGQPFDLGIILVIGIAFVLVVMFTMAHAWIETPMLLATIGIAVLLNMGTNFIFESVSDTTFSIAAVLQLILSLDYSLMLLSRYRKERKLTDDKFAAMEKALVGATKSIASSSVTTIVGLVCLVFMSFTIGADMGLVLAKGVFMSLVCVFAIMPAFVLAGDKLLISTQKRSPIPTMQRVTNLVYKARVPLTVGFCILLGLGFFFRNSTGTTFFMPSENEDRPVIQQYFDLDTQVVILYKTSEEKDFQTAAASIEDDDRVSSLTSYSTTLGKELSAVKMADDLDMDGSFVKLLYYRALSNQLYNLTPHQFATFVQDQASSDSALGNQMEGASDEDLATLVRLTDPDKIQSQRTAKSMVSYLSQDSGFSVSDMQQLYLAYYEDKGGVALGTMTLPQFVAFMQNDVAKSSLMADQVSKKDLQQISEMAPYTDASAMTRQRSAANMAKKMDMSADQVTSLYKAHALSAGTADTGTMTIVEFMAFLQNDVAANPQYASMVTPEAIAAMQAALATLPADMLNAPYTAKEMAAVLARAGLDEATVTGLYQYHWVLHGSAKGITMSCQEFITYLVKDVATNPSTADQLSKDTVAQLTQAKSIIDASVAGTAFTPAKLASFLGMNKSDAKSLYCYYQWQNGGKNSWTLDALTLVNYLVAQGNGGSLSGQISASELDSLSRLRDIMAASTMRTAYDAVGMANLMGALSDELTEDNVSLLYLLWASEKHYDKSFTMSLDEFMTFLHDTVLSDSMLAPQLSESDKRDITDGYETMMEGKDRLVGPTYSMATVTVPYADESPEMDSFLTDLRSNLDANLSGNYLIGQGPMAQEMGASFTDEFNFISILTALAIFLIVALTFRSFFIPLLLVLLIQCAFCLTMGLNSLLGSDIYYLALIVVQAILMGATIDYAILFTNNYREARRVSGVKQSIGSAYLGSVRTMLTSGVVLVLVTAILGIGCTGIVGQICLVISQGCGIALLLVMFILPALLAVLDKFIMGKKPAAPANKGEEVTTYHI